jgi:hypothetical protein
MGNIQANANQNNKYLNGSPVALTTVCPPPAASYTSTELMKLYNKGIATDKLVQDPQTGRIPVAALADYVTRLEANGTIKKLPEVKVGADVEIKVDERVKNDAELFTKFNDEYCYYEQRYRYALKQFLTFSTSRLQADNVKAEAMLENTKVLNRRLNSLLEIMNYMAAARVSTTNMNKDAINNYNQTINERLAKLKQNYSMLEKENAIVETQKEAVRYTQEKNNYTSNQIAIWGALNVLALATTFYVYRN